MNTDSIIKAFKRCNRYNLTINTKEDEEYIKKIIIIYKFLICNEYLKEIEVV